MRRGALGPNSPLSNRNVLVKPSQLNRSDTTTVSHLSAWKVGARESIWPPPEDTVSGFRLDSSCQTRAITCFYWCVNPGKMAHEVLRLVTGGMLVTGIAKGAAKRWQQYRSIVLVKATTAPFQKKETDKYRPERLMPTAIACTRAGKMALPISL